MSSEFENRRRHLRVNHSQIVSYTHFNERDEVDKTGGIGTTTDISMGGVLIRVADEFEHGTKIALEISLGDKLIKATGQITRVQKIESDL